MSHQIFGSSTTRRSVTAIAVVSIVISGTVFISSIHSSRESTTDARRNSPTDESLPAIQLSDTSPLTEATTAAPQTSERTIAPDRPTQSQSPSNDSTPSAPLFSNHLPATGLTDASTADSDSWFVARNSETVGDNALRWSTDSTGASRILPYQWLADGSFLFGTNSSPQPALNQAISGPIRSEANALESLRTIAMVSDDLVVLGRGIDESSLIDLDPDTAPALHFDADDETEAPDSSQPKNGEAPAGDDSDDPVIFTAEPTGPIVLSDSLRPVLRGSTPSPQLVPEPITVPILLCGWLLFFAGTRRRRIFDDVRSFRLPPGNSDVTAAQLASVRRTTFRVSHR